MENRKIKEEARLTSWLPRWRSKLWGESTSIQKKKQQQQKTKKKKEKEKEKENWVLEYGF